MIALNLRFSRFPREFVVQVPPLPFASLLIVWVLVGSCLGSSNPAGVPAMVANVEGLSVAVQPNDGAYEIQTGKGGRSVIHARVAAEIDHKWVKSTDYPKHQISQSTFEDALGRGQEFTVISYGLANLPDLAYTLQIYEGKYFGVIEESVQNHTPNPVTVQSIRSVEAVGDHIIDLGGAHNSDRVLSDSFSEDWPPLQIYDLGKAPQGMHRAVGSQLIYNRESKESIFFGALTSDRFLTIMHLKANSDSEHSAGVASYTVDSTGTTEIQATDPESCLRHGPAKNLVELSLPVAPGATLGSERLMFAQGNNYYSILDT